jgi:hypothetical protein
MEFTRHIDNGIYSRKALAEAREAYGKYCSVRANPASSGDVAVTVLLKQEYKGEARQVILEFWNFFLDSSCKHKLESA